MFDKSQPFALDQIITGYREGRPYVKIVLLDGRESTAFYQETSGKLLPDSEPAVATLHNRFISDHNAKGYKGYKQNLYDDIRYNLRKMK